jgi:FkbM family methyltransferase
MWFQSSVARARTYLIEPVPHKLQVGIGNYQLNNLRGDFRNAFIGAVSTKHGQFTDWDGSVVDIPCVAIDDFLDNEQIGFLDVLHADIQGAELEMLQGCGRSLADNRIGYVFVSTHADKHKPCLVVLCQAGYEVVAEHSVEESCSGDGLIVARGMRAPRIPPIEITKGNATNRIRESLDALAGLLKNNNRRLWRAVRSRKDDIRQDEPLSERRRIDNS